MLPYILVIILVFVVAILIRNELQKSEETDNGQNESDILKLNEFASASSDNTEIHIDNKVPLEKIDIINDIALKTENDNRDESDKKDNGETGNDTLKLNEFASASSDNTEINIDNEVHLEKIDIINDTVLKSEKIKNDDNEYELNKTENQSNTVACHNQNEEDAQLFIVEEKSTQNEREIYTSEKINYNNTVAKSDLKEKFSQMKKIKIKKPSLDYFDQNYNEKYSEYLSELFYKQAYFMKDVTDNYNGCSKCYYYSPGYDDLNYRQLRTYVTWRTKVRQGVIVKTDQSYVYIYINELANKISDLDDKALLMHFIDFATQYSQLDPYFNYDFKIWIKDFYIMNDIPCSFEEIDSLLPKRLKNNIERFEKPNRDKYAQSVNLLNKISSYKFLESNFFKTEYGYLLIDGINYSFKIIEEYLKGMGIDFFNMIYSYNYYEYPWNPYGRLHFYRKPQKLHKEKEFVSGEKFIYDNGVGSRWCYYYDFNIFRGAVGYSIKLIENELRKLLGYKYKLRPNPVSVINDAAYYMQEEKSKNQIKVLEIFTTEKFSQLVVNAVHEFFDTTNIELKIMSDKSHKKSSNINGKNNFIPVSVELDVGKFAAIRESSQKIQEVLVSEDEEESSENLDIQKNIAPKIEEKIKIFDLDNSKSEFVRFKASLSEVEIKALSAILDCDENTDTKLNSLALKYCEMPQTIIDDINEKALEYISDNLIDTSDVICIYDDYIDEIRNVFKEDKYE